MTPITTGRWRLSSRFQPGPSLASDRGAPAQAPRADVDAQAWTIAKIR